MLPLLSSPMLKKGGEEAEGAEGRGAIKRRFFVTGNVHAGAPHLVSPLSLSPCLHARVLQSWNGKFLAAFGVKFAGSAVKCAVSRTLHYALTRDDVFMRQLCKNLWFSGREANLEKWPMRPRGAVCALVSAPRHTKRAGTQPDQEPDPLSKQVRHDLARCIAAGPHISSIT